MKYEISPDRKRLTILAEPGERAELCWQAEVLGIRSNAAMFDWLESMISNSELEWIFAVDTGDLTDAPMLGILGDEATARKINRTVPQHYGLVPCGHKGRHKLFQPILERWAYMDYQVRSVLEDLRDKGKAVFVNGE